jgi:hypothetical protein
MAAITPGIHPQMVRIKTSRTAPHPLSITASGGKIMQIIALRSPMNTRKIRSNLAKNGGSRTRNHSEIMTLFTSVY